MWSIPTAQHRSKESDSLHAMARSCCVGHSPTVFDQQLLKSVTSNFNKQSRNPKKEEQNPIQC